MSDAPTMLRPVAAEPDPGLVEMLRELLAKAEAGEILALAFAAEMTGHEIARAISLGNGCNVWALVGAMRMQEYGLLARFAAEDE